MCYYMDIVKGRQKTTIKTGNIWRRITTKLLERKHQKIQTEERSLTSMTEENKTTYWSRKFQEHVGRENSA